MGAIPKDSPHRPNLPLEALVDILLAVSLGSWKKPWSEVTGLKQDKGSDDAITGGHLERGPPLRRKLVMVMSKQRRASSPASYRQAMVLASRVLIPSYDIVGKVTFSGIFPSGLGPDVPDFLTKWHSNRSVSGCHLQVGGNWWSHPRRTSSCGGPRNRWSFLVMTSHEGRGTVPVSDGAIGQGTYSGDGLTGGGHNPATAALWEGGLIFSEDPQGRAWSSAMCPRKMALSVVTASWDGGIFSIAEKRFPCDGHLLQRPGCSG